MNFVVIWICNRELVPHFVTSCSMCRTCSGNTGCRKYLKTFFTAVIQTSG